MKPIELERGLFAGKPTAELLNRVLYALLAQPECLYPGRGTWQPPTPDQLANWEARQTLVSLIEKP